MLRTGGGRRRSRACAKGARAIGGRKETAARRARVAEVIASVVLLVATGLLVRALWTIQGTDPGFRAEGVLTLRTDLPPAKYAVTARRAEFYNRVSSEVRALPGVTNAAYISGLPMVWGGGIWPVGINGVELERRDNNTASMRFVTPGFFATLSVPLRTGRDVSDSDTMTTQFVAVVSESLRQALLARPGCARPDVQLRRRTIGPSSASSATFACAGSSATASRRSTCRTGRSTDGWFWGYTPKELVVSATTPLAQLVPAVREHHPDAPIRSSRSPTCGR